MQNNKSKLIGFMVIILISTSATTGVVILDSLNRKSNATTTTITSPSQSTVSAYKDGQYTASGSFYTPGGDETIAVTVNLSGGVIKNVSIDNSAVYSRESMAYCMRFSHSVGNYVDGKKIDSVNLSRISGASLTPMGFNDAIDQIKADARA